MRLRPLWTFVCVIAAPAAAEPVSNCAVGTYRLTDGSVIDVAVSEPTPLRWRKTDGTTGALSPPKEGSSTGQWTSTLGWTGKPDGTRVSFDCAGGTIDFNRQKGHRINFQVTNVQFKVEGATLAGRLVMPTGHHRVPVVVLTHGAEHDSALQLNALQRMFPAAGIGAFVYDKRGTGASSGRYTQDFLMLAEDAVAAQGEARSLAGSRVGRVGYQGPSEGGWVAPLAARIAPVDFVIVSFGLAVSPIAAERESIMHDAASLGLPSKDGNEMVDVIATLLSSNFQEGYDQLAEVQRKFGDKPWFKNIGTGFAQVVLPASAAMLREKGPVLLPGATYDYDPMPVLRGLATPQLWVLGGQDRDAPPFETTGRLRELVREGRPITVAIFPKAEHGIYEFEAAPDRSRVSTRQPAGYFPIMRDFILTGRISGNYGAEVAAGQRPRR